MEASVHARSVSNTRVIGAAGLTVFLSLVFRHRHCEHNSARCTTSPQQTLSYLAVFTDGSDVVSKFAVIPQNNNKAVEFSICPVFAGVVGRIWS